MVNAKINPKGRKKRNWIEAKVQENIELNMMMMMMINKNSLD